MHFFAAYNALVVGGSKFCGSGVRVQSVHVANRAPRQHHVIVRFLETPAIITSIIPDLDPTQHSIVFHSIISYAIFICILCTSLTTKFSYKFFEWSYIFRYIVIFMCKDLASRYSQLDFVKCKHVCYKIVSSHGDISFYYLN